MNYLKLLIIVVKNTRGKEKENHVNYLKFVFHWTDHDYKILPLSTVCLGTLKFLIRERSFSNISFEMYKDYCGRCWIFFRARWDDIQVTQKHQHRVVGAEIPKVAEALFIAVGSIAKVQLFKWLVRHQLLFGCQSSDPVWDKAREKNSDGATLSNTIIYQTMTDMAQM